MHLSFPVISPTLRYGDEVIDTDTTITHSAPETVSCELYNAGPPLPESLALTLTEGDSISGVLTSDYVRNNETCSWSYPDPLELVINDLTETVRLLTFLFDLNYLESNIIKVFNYNYAVFVTGYSAMPCKLRRHRYSGITSAHPARRHHRFSPINRW